MIALLQETGSIDGLTSAALPPPTDDSTALLPEIDRHFASATLPDLLASLRHSDSEFAAKTLKTMTRNSPLAMACALEMLHLLAGKAGIRDALDLEYRFTFRAMQHGDFLEGIRAAIIDKDRSPHWRHTLDDVPPEAIQTMLAPLGADALHWEEI
jgi:enoyl-CoA hydratase/carnithine racemase